MKTKIFAFGALLFLSGGLVWAANYDLKEKTPEVAAALQNRQSRYGQLQSLKASGAVGENNQGLVHALDASAQATVDAENRDRNVIYKAIADQNGLGPGGLPQIHGAFAEVQRSRAKPGESIQDASGRWVKK